MNIKKLYKNFTAAYNFIYDHENKVPGYYMMIQLFENELKFDEDFQKALDEFNAYREDFVSSDREMAAFMFAYGDTLTGADVA